MRLVLMEAGDGKLGWQAPSEVGLLFYFLYKKN
jgi:hypothetical protein